MANKSKFFDPNDYTCLMFPANHPPAWWRDKIVQEPGENPEPIKKRSTKPQAAERETAEVEIIF